MLEIADMARAARKRRKPTLPHDPNLKAVQVENPYWSPAHAGDRSNPRFIPAMVNLRESAIVAMFYRGALSAAQFRAAETFRHLFEAAGGKGAGAIDYTRERVDGGRIPDPISSAHLDAGRELADVYRHLTGEYGRYAWNIVTQVCGEGKSLVDLAPEKRLRLTLADNLRSYLNCLCVFWGIATRY